MQESSLPGSQHSAWPINTQTPLEPIQCYQNHGAVIPPPAMPVEYVTKSFQNALKSSECCYWEGEWATEKYHKLLSRQVVELGLQNIASVMCSSHWALFASCKKIKAAIHAEDTESARTTP